MHERIPAGASIAVLGAAQNDDALWFASQGHLVTAVWSVDTTREETEKLGPDAVHTIVMDSYDFDFPEKLRVQNEQLSRHAADWLIAGCVFGGGAVKPPKPNDTPCDTCMVPPSVSQLPVVLFLTWTKNCPRDGTRERLMLRNFLPAYISIEYRQEAFRK